METNVTKIEKKPETQDHKEKKPTKKEMFEKHIRQSFLDMIESDKKQLTTAQGFISYATFVKQLYSEEELEQVELFDEAQIYRKAANSFLDDMKKVIEKWTYNKFIKLEDDPFGVQHLSIDTAPTAKELCSVLSIEALVTPYFKAIQDGQTRLNQCA